MTWKRRLAEVACFAGIFGHKPPYRAHFCDHSGAGYTFRPAGIPTVRTYRCSAFRQVHFSARRHPCWVHKSVICVPGGDVRERKSVPGSRDHLVSVPGVDVRGSKSAPGPSREAGRAWSKLPWRYPTHDFGSETAHLARLRASGILPTCSLAQRKLPWGPNAHLRGW